MKQSYSFTCYWIKNMFNYWSVGCWNSYIMNPINIVQQIIGINSWEARRCTSVPCNIDCVGGAWSIVKNFEFILMRVTVELPTDDHMEPVDDATIFTSPEMKATSSGEVAQDMNSLVILFGSKKGLVQPLHGGLDFSATVDWPPIERVTVVAVQSNDTESRSN